MEFKEELSKYTKIINNELEKHIRRDGLDEAKKAEKDGDITEDDLRNAETEIQKLTDKKTDEIDRILAAKEKEVMSV